MVFAFSEKYDSPARPDDSRAHPDLAVVIPAWNERENIELLLPALREVIAGLGLTAEIVVADGGSRDGTAEAAQRRGGPGVVQKETGYGSPLLAGFSAPSGPYNVPPDAHFSHPPVFPEKVSRRPP